jgi:hypothetical protein
VEEDVAKNEGSAVLRTYMGDMPFMDMFTFAASQREW